MSPPPPLADDPDALALSSWTPRPQVGRVLDLGTGSGVQVLHLAGHTAYPVVATDVSTRALAFAAFTAALNGVDLDLRHGSLLEPVAGEEFDLIASNPPFVITPRREGVPRYEYRDGGAVGDSFVAHLVRDLGAHLRPGGIAQLLASWELRPGGRLRRVIRLDTLGAGLVGVCDGELTARQLCVGLGVLTETGVEQVEAGVLPVLRELVKDGLLHRSRQVGEVPVGQGLP